MKLTVTEWKDTEELIAKIKEFASDSKTETPQEIERKWLVSPKMIKHLRNSELPYIHKEQLQGYISIDPEIRYRASNNYTTKEIQYFLAYKSNGGLVRDEFEVEITDASAMKVAAYIRKTLVHLQPHKPKFITKDSWRFTLNDGTEIWVSTVDNDPKFTYSEIEFSSTEEADSYQLPADLEQYVLRDVTEDVSYKMKNYWKRTRNPK